MGLAGFGKHAGKASTFLDWRQVLPTIDRKNLLS